MSKAFKYCLPVILFCTFSILACKKAIEEKNVLTDEVLSPPFPQLCLGTCNVSSAPDFSDWFGEALSSSYGELRAEIKAESPALFSFTYDANNNPATCQGLGPGACYFEHFNSAFTYTNGNVTSILVDHTYSNIGCPQYTNLTNVHTGSKIDLAYSTKVVTVAGLSFFFPVINATVYKSDTLPIGQNFVNWTATGRTYYYEYGALGLADNQLKIKRFKENANAITKEYRYTYDSVGHLSKVSTYEANVEKFRITIYAFDTKRNFASGNKVMQLLTSTYGKNNSKEWYSQSFYTNPTTWHFYTADYLYNSHCYPVTATITFDSQTFTNPSISYTCY